MPRPTLRGGVLGTVAATALALTACGGAGSSGSAGTPSAAAQQAAPATSAPATSTPAPSAQPAAVTVMTASNARLGTIVVDHAGMTLYTLTSNGRAVACTGQCLKFWPPLTVPNRTTPTGGAGTGTLSTTTAADGSRQVTVNGFAVYRFSGDSGAGMTNGQGIRSFGGIWQVVKAGASAAAAGSTNTAPNYGSVPGY